MACSDNKGGGEGVTGGGSGTTGGVSGNTGGAAKGGAGSGTCAPGEDAPVSATTNITLCQAYCAAQTACGTSEDDCLGYYTCEDEDDGSTECVAAAKLFWKCMAAQSEKICTAEADCCWQASDEAFSACASD